MAAVAAAEDVRLQALRDAQAITCGHCRAGDPINGGPEGQTHLVSRRGRGQWGEERWYDKLVPCHAFGIRALIQQREKELA